jgi:hypothetical protein
MAFRQLRAPIPDIRSNFYAGLGGRVLTDLTGERRNRQFRKYFRGLQSCQPEHLSVYQAFPELRKREAFEEKLDGAPEATGEPGKPSAGELGRLAVRVFFSAGAGLLAWSHMPVETAQ